MSETFRQIGLIGKSGDSKVIEALTAYLAQRGVAVLLDRSIGDDLPSTKHEVAERETLARRCDLAIVVGGDGTLLNAGRSLAESGIPVLGINLGRLGFLVDVSPYDMTYQLDRILAGEFIRESRSLLSAVVHRDGKAVTQSDALNDVVVHKWDIARMIELEAYIDGKYLNTNRADGLIITTPTGSTAYALSGGGPIMHPGLDAISLVTICPHTLSNRPIVINDKSIIEVVVCADGTAQVQITCDGQVSYPLVAGDRISVQKKEHPLNLIHPADYDYYAILRAKLHWSEYLSHRSDRDAE
jgi:NAD+ kinase